MKYELTLFNFSVLHVDEVVSEGVVLIVLVDGHGVVAVVVFERGAGRLGPHAAHHQPQHQQHGDDLQGGALREHERG